MKDCTGHELEIGEYVLTLEEFKFVFGVVTNLSPSGGIVLIVPEDGRENYPNFINNPQILFRVDGNQIPNTILKKMVDLAIQARGSY